MADKPLMFIAPQNIILLKLAKTHLQQGIIANSHCKNTIRLLASKPITNSTLRSMSYPNHIISRI
tara:strand:- start:548 stop:742 length:195 start_codon:yes stop_codon:yes gene_type:complete